ncbi:MAG: relaxase/mobilization nuclease domain-containing protein, partial [Oscillospiraceae bacterium]|nr:relaxase/mobilization nuclease domain-containing protein [Oscillospiraceae bacterium]
MRNRTRQQSMAERHNYDQKAEKTNDGELMSSYMCSPETAAEEFEISKKLYHQITGRTQSPDHDVIMYRVIQSFKPGEVSPEEANRIGYELAMKFTGGQHQFVVSTHVDKAHIHTHIEFNSTNLNCDGKFRDVKGSAMVLRWLNDELCKAHGLSVIENPKPSAKKQKEMAAAKYGTSHKEQLRQTIDRVLPDCKSYEDFLAKMRSEGYEIKEGKTLSFRAPGWDRFTRSNKLGANYTREALRERSSTRRGRSAEAKKPVPHAGREVNMLIDIQAKIAAGKGAGYERWAKIFNLKEAAKT